MEQARSKAAAIFPFAVAVVLPPAGFLLGMITAQEDRNLGVWIMAIAVLAAGVWGLFVATVA